MQLLIFWGSYLWFPFALGCLYVAIHQRQWPRQVALLALVLTLPLAWARFVEPQILLTQTTKIDLSAGAAETRTLRIALFADTQYGLFSNVIKIDRIVDRILSEKVDAVFMAGDWLMESPLEDIPHHLAGLERLRAAGLPIYGVLGNHDIYINQPKFSQTLYAALRRAGVILAENRAYETELAGLPILIAGASDLLYTRQDFAFRADLPDSLPLILLTHNPDTAFNVPDSFSYDLMLAGHTHGGQINLFWPALMQRFIPTRYPFNEGLHSVPGQGPVFVTAGIGQTGLPMRFLRPPRIDLLELTLAAPTAPN